METIEIKDSTRRDILGSVVMPTVFIIGVGLAMTDRARPGLGTFWMLFSALIRSPFIYRLVNR